MNISSLRQPDFKSNSCILLLQISVCFDTESSRHSFPEKYVLETEEEVSSGKRGISYISLNLATGKKTEKLSAAVLKHSIFRGLPWTESKEGLVEGLAFPTASEDVPHSVCSLTLSKRLFSGYFSCMPSTWAQACIPSGWWWDEAPACARSQFCTSLDNLASAQPLPAPKAVLSCLNASADGAQMPKQVCLPWRLFGHQRAAHVWSLIFLETIPSPNA